MINKTLLLLRAVLITALFSSTSLYATDTSKMTIIKLTTNQGEITLELDAEKAPNTVANFVSYIEDDFFNGRNISPYYS